MHEIGPGILASFTDGPLDGQQLALPHAWTFYEIQELRQTGRYVRLLHQGPGVHRYEWRGWYEN